MSLGRRIAFAVGAGWAGRLVTLGLSLTLTPMLFASLGKESIGIWYLLAGSSSTLLFVLDLGATATLTRRMGLARGKSGSDPSATLDESTRVELADLLASGQRVFRILACVSFLAAIASGGLLLPQLELDQSSLRVAWLAWCVLCAAQGIRLWSQAWYCLLSGSGFVGWATVLDTVTLAAASLAQIVWVWSGGGILGMAVLTAIAALGGRAVLLRGCRRLVPEVDPRLGRWSSPLVRSMLGPSLRAWLTAVGAFLILRTDQFFISLVLGPASLPDYQASYQLVSNLYLLAISFAVGSSVFISHLWQAGELPRLHRLVYRNVRAGLFVMVSGVAFLASVGDELLYLWLPSGNFVGYPVLLTFCLMLLLEAHHVMLAHCSRATEHEVFVGPALFAGILNLVLTFLLVHRFGLLGVALGTLVAQALTNNWYVVYRSLNRLQLSFADYWRATLWPAVVLLVTVWCVNTLLVTIVPQPWAKCLLAGGATGGCLLMAVWFGVLDLPLRDRTRSAVRQLLAVAHR